MICLKPSFPPPKTRAAKPAQPIIEISSDEDNSDDEWLKLIPEKVRKYAGATAKSKGSPRKVVQINIKGNCMATKVAKKPAVVPAKFANEKTIIVPTKTFRPSMKEGFMKCDRGNVGCYVDGPLHGIYGKRWF